MHKWQYMSRHNHSAQWIRNKYPDSLIWIGENVLPIGKVSPKNSGNILLYNINHIFLICKIYKVHNNPTIRQLYRMYYINMYRLLYSCINYLLYNDMYSWVLSVYLYLQIVPRCLWIVVVALLILLKNYRKKIRYVQ